MWDYCTGLQLSKRTLTLIAKGKFQQWGVSALINVLCDDYDYLEAAEQLQWDELYKRQQNQIEEGIVHCGMLTLMAVVQSVQKKVVRWYIT